MQDLREDSSTPDGEPASSLNATADWMPAERPLDLPGILRRMRRGALAGILVLVLMTGTSLAILIPRRIDYRIDYTVSVSGIVYLDAAGTLIFLRDIAKNPTFWEPVATELGADYSAEKIRSRITLLTVTDPYSLAFQVSGDNKREALRVAHSAVESFSRRAPALLPNPLDKQAVITVAEPPAVILLGGRDSLPILLAAATLTLSVLTAVLHGGYRSKPDGARQRSVSTDQQQK